jgi:hypothetical protein
VGEAKADDSGRSPWAKHGGKVCVPYAATAVLIMASACSAPISANKKQNQFQCTVTGAAMLPERLDEVAVCAMFKDRIDARLPLPAKTVNAVSKAGGGDWLKLDIRISKNNSAGAVLSRQNGGRQMVHPEIVIDVMDKALGKQELEKLADEVAKLVSDKVED